MCRDDVRRIVTLIPSRFDREEDVLLNWRTIDRFSRETFTPVEHSCSDPLLRRLDFSTNYPFDVDLTLSVQSLRDSCDWGPWSVQRKSLGPLKRLCRHSPLQPGMSYTPRIRFRSGHGRGPLRTEERGLDTTHLTIVRETFFVDSDGTVVRHQGDVTVGLIWVWFSARILTALSLTTHLGIYWGTTHKVEGSNLSERVHVMFGK